MKHPLKTPERIAFAGDWHMDANRGQEGIRYAQYHGADVIVHLGDFGYLYEQHFIDTLEHELSTQNMHLLFIDGNHENFPRLHSYRVQEHGLRTLREHIHHIPRGFRWKWGNTEFTGVGGAHSVDKQLRRWYLEWWPEESISIAQMLNIVDEGTTDILLAHDCPTGVAPLDQFLSKPPPFPESEIQLSEAHRGILRQIVDEIKPRILLHGHYHYYYETQTDFGYGPVQIYGLADNNAPISENIVILDLSEL